MNLLTSDCCRRDNGE